MKKSIYTLVSAIVFIAGATLLTSCGSGTTNESESSEHQHDHDAMLAVDYACPMHSDEIGKEGDKCSKCGMLLTKEVEVDSVAYSCPMHPNEKGVKGDTCSQCKMSLVASKGTCNHKDGEKCTCKDDKVASNCSCEKGACTCGTDQKVTCNHKDGEKCTCNKVAMKCDHKKGDSCPNCKKA